MRWQVSPMQGMSFPKPSVGASAVRPGWPRYVLDLGVSNFGISAYTVNNELSGG